MKQLVRFSYIQYVNSLVLLAATLFTAAAFSQTPGDFDLQSAPGGKYTLDKTHGYVTFSYSHQGYSRPWLRFRSLDATLKLNEKDIQQSTLKVSIDPSSIDSGVDIFDDHLLGKNHFDVKNHSSITFEATKIEVNESNVAITGDLTVKGNTAPVTLQGSFNRGGLHFQSKKPVLGFSATTQLKRSEWGLGYAVPFVGDMVDVVIEVEFNRVGS